jgi:hypothetical protein
MFGWFKKTGKPAHGPDFSGIDSREKALDLWRRGELQKLLLMPPEFGGEDVPPNVVYVPAFAVELKRRLDTNTIRPLVEEQKVRRYSAEPQYEGASFVPCAIKITASDPANFTTVLRIWGKALASE